MATANTFSSLVHTLVGLINQVLPVLSAVAVAIFLWGCVRYIYATQSEGEKAAARDAMVWGLVALFVIFSFWGILAFLQQNLPLSY